MRPRPGLATPNCQARPDRRLSLPRKNVLSRSERRQFLRLALFQADIYRYLSVVAPVRLRLLRANLVQPGPVLFVEARVPAFGGIGLSGDEDRFVLRCLLQRGTVSDDKI